MLGASFRLLIVALLGVAAGLAVFAPLSLHVYLKHEFPLVVVPIYLAKAYVLAALCLLWYRLLVRRHGARWLAGAACVALVIDHAVIQAVGVRDSDGVDTSWIDRLPAYADSSFVVSWIAQTADPFLANWSVALPPGREQLVLGRIAAMEAPFELDDYFIFGQRNVSNPAVDYTKPDYWLYFATESLSEFDRPEPVCRSDYIVEFLSRLLRPRMSREPTLPIQTWALTAPFAPGSRVPVYGIVDGLPQSLERVFVAGDNVPETELNYNCIHRSVAGAFTLPDRVDGDVFDIHFFAERTDGSITRMNTLQVPVSVEAVPYPEERLLPWTRANQLSAGELATALDLTPVDSLGDDWAIFDMREIYRRIDQGNVESAPTADDSEERTP